MSDDRLRCSTVVGFSLLWVGLGGTAALRLLQRVDPRSWGGPNIGGGLLLLACWAMAAVGAVFVIAAIALPVSRRSFATGTWWTATAISAVLIAGLFAVRLVPTSSDNGVRGWVGVTVSDSGSVTVVVESCGSAVDEISVVGPNRGDTPNQELARYRAATPATGEFAVDLAHPRSGWTADPTLPGPSVGADQLRIVTARGPSTELRQVSFAPADLAGLDPDSVLYSVSSTGRARASRAAFQTIACR